MPDKRTLYAMNWRHFKLDRVCQLVDRLMEDEELWSASKLYQIRDFPTKKLFFNTKCTINLAGIDLRFAIKSIDRHSTKSLFLSSAGTLFETDIDLFGIFYNHVRVDNLSEQILDDLLNYDIQTV